MYAFSLRELLAKRTSFRSDDGIAAPERKQLVDALFKRTNGVRCHRVVCRLDPSKVCGLTFHTFHYRDGGGFEELSKEQQRMIEAAAPEGLMLEFKIHRCNFKHWKYEAECSADPLNHSIVVSNHELPHPPGERHYKKARENMFSQTLAQISLRS